MKGLDLTLSTQTVCKQDDDEIKVNFIVFHVSVCGQTLVLVVLKSLASDFLGSAA